MVAGGVTSKASALVLAPDEPCPVLSAQAAGPRFCLKADPVDSQVQLTWSPSAPPRSVIVYYAPPGRNGRPATVANATDKGALVTGLKNDSTYTFWLVIGKTVESDTVSATPVATPVNAPGTPAGLTATPGDATVTLAWDPPASDGRPLANGYNVYQGTSPGGETGTPINSSPVTSTSYTVPGLTNGTTYYFTVKAVSSNVNAINQAGNGETEGQASCEVPATPVTVPGAPAGLTAKPGDATVTLAWDPPASDGGSPVTGYDVYQGTSPGGETGTPVNGSLITSTSYPVTGLTSGSTYYFTVKAVTSSVSAINRAGNGETEGQASCEVSATPLTVPGAPAGLTANPGDQQVNLSWSAPASDGGSPVTGYDVYQGTSPGGETGTPVNGSLVTSTSYPVTGLTNGTTYYFTVKAVNAQGLGAAPGEVLAVPVTVPGAPAGLTAAPGDAKLTLAWSAPTSDGGSPVTGYNVYYATSPADFKWAAGVTGTALALVGLVNGTPYYVRVTAVNKLGESQPSSVVLATPVTVPAAPAGLTAVADNAQVTLKWDTPASDGGSPVTGYDVYVGTTAHFSGRAPLAKVTGNAVTVTGLVNGTTYYFRMTAVNKVGEGPASNEVPATPQTVPGAPAGLTATPGNSKVTLAWAAPASGGAPIRGYIIYKGTSPGGETGTPVNGSLVTATSYTVTGLTNGTTYYFEVAAANAAGLSPLSGEASATLQSSCSPRRRPARPRRPVRPRRPAPPRRSPHRLG